MSEPEDYGEWLQATRYDLDAYDSAYIDGYAEALRDLVGPHQDDRLGVLCADPERSAWLSATSRGLEWLEPLVEYAYQWRLAQQRRRTQPQPAMSEREPAQLKLGTVYVFRDANSDTVKIGFTAGPVEQRMKSVASASGRTLSLLGSYPGTLLNETKEHARWHYLRLNGEWFTATPEIVAWAEELL